MLVSTAALYALFLAGVLFLATLPLAGRARRQDGDRIGRILRWGLVAKLLAAPLQIAVVERFFGGVADFNLYHNLASKMVEGFPQSLFAEDAGRVVGIRFVTSVTATIYAVLGVNKLAAFLIFAWLGFVGQYLFYRAFRTALPEGDKVRYAVLVFFLPSIVFWPSTIGKDAFMCFALGLSALGCARVLDRRRGGFVLAVAGLAAGTLVRPHVVLLLFVAASLAYLLRKARRPDSMEFMAKAVGVVAILVGGVVLVGNVEAFLGVEGGVGAVDQVLERTSRTSQGQDIGDVDLENGFGSSFDPTPLRSPLLFPLAVATVLFRPWPFEAASVAALAASLEGILLLGIMVAGRRRIFNAVRMARRRPYVALVLIYAVMFIYFFAAVGNFGILVRQKVQVLPLLLVLLAFPRRDGTDQLPPAAEGAQPAMTSTTRSRS